MTNAIDRETAITATIEAIASRIPNRAARDAKLGDDGQRRSASYLAFFATTAFAEIATDAQIDLEQLFNRCDKTLNRVELLLKALATGEFFLRNESDQNRYSFDLIKTLINAHNAKVAMITRSDASATASKTDTASDYVQVATRNMAASTQSRQGGIATYVLETLGMVEFERSGKNIVGYKVKPKTAFFKRMSAMVKKAQAVQNA